MHLPTPTPFAAALLAGAILTANGLTALAATPNASSRFEEEVVVSAQKRDQNIEDVPVTMTAFSGDLLQELGVDRLDRLSDMVPGLVVQQQSVNNNGYVIRGITSDDGESSSAPRVSVYLNGTDVSRSRGSYFEVYDMARVEVVKGPQATLFGTAASIGALSFITNKPQQEFAAELNASAGDYGMHSVGGFITGGDSLLQGRLAFVAKARDGYVDNHSSDRDEQDLNGYDRFAIRPSLRLTPRDDLSIDLVYNHDKASDPGTAFTRGASVFSDDAALSVPVNTNLGDNRLGVERQVDDVSATVSWDINESLSLTYIAAHRRYDSSEVFDADGTDYPFLNFAEDAEGDQSSHELRLNFKGERLNGFVGASYFTEAASQRVPFATEEGLFFSCLGQLAGYGISSCNSGSTAALTNALSGGAVTIPAIPYQLEYTNSADNQSRSLFADLSWQATDKLELTAGVRYVDESRESAYRSDLPVSYFTSQLAQMTTGFDETTLLAAGVPLDIFGGAFYNTQGQTLRGSSDDSALLPRLNALYALTDELNLYATLAKGQRSQVVLMDSGSKAVVPAEEVINYEAGIKGNSAGGRLAYSASVFYQDYQNFQVSVIDDNGQSVTKNAGNATNVGVETELRWALSEAFSLLANVAWIDAAIDDDDSNGEYAGNRFRLQPEWSGALSYLYRAPLLAGMDLVSSASWSYRSSTYFDIENQYEQGSVDLLNLRLGLAASDDNWAVTAFASNLLDEEYLMDAGNTGSAFGYPTYIKGAPRMLGLELVKRFH